MLLQLEYKFVWLSRNSTLTGLLSECGGFALAILRHGDDADVIVNARFQSVDCVMTRRGLHHVFKDGYTLASCNHGDPVASDGGGVDRCPAEADRGVAHILKAEVGQLWNFWMGGKRIWGEGGGGGGRKKKTEMPKKTNKQRGKCGGQGWGLNQRKEKTDTQEAVVKLGNTNWTFSRVTHIQHVTLMEELMLCLLLLIYILPFGDI